MARPLMELADVPYQVRTQNGWTPGAVPLTEAEVGPGYQAVPWRAEDGPALAAVPDGEGGYRWAEWAEARELGWGEGSGGREHEGELERRFVVFHYEPPRRAWPFFWRVVEGPPLRVAHCRDVGEAEWHANRWLPCLQMPFQWEGSGHLVRAWGWDTREAHPHLCDGDLCICVGEPEAPHGEFVLIAEFDGEAAAMRPDVRLEREAWVAMLDAERASALTAHCEGGCDPTCAHCLALSEEVEAAWQWLADHPRQRRAWRRERARRRASGEAREREVARC